MQPELIYIHDPMCSWCWGFERTRRQLFASLPGNIGIRRLLGGLAADNNQPMSPEMRHYIQQTWKQIEDKIPGIKFNFDFWKKCQPRRSTYQACRAVIAARQQGDKYDMAMTGNIQRAYYREAKNPSDTDTLVELAAKMGLDASRFAYDLKARETERCLQDEIQQAARLGTEGMPALVLKADNQIWPIAIDYLDAGVMLEVIELLLDRQSKQ
jgi:putative protein-disulfide isomerase